VSPYSSTNGLSAQVELNSVDIVGLVYLQLEIYIDCSCKLSYSYWISGQRRNWEVVDCVPYGLAFCRGRREVEEGGECCLRYCQVAHGVSQERGRSDFEAEDMSLGSCRDYVWRSSSTN
jgi:hypothetical protein